MNTNKPLYLIDGSGFIFRAYHALPPLTRKSDGTPVGAVYGFCNILLRVLEEAGNAYIAVIFDTAKKTFRNDIYKEYKANRPPAPEDLVPQFPLVRDACEAFGVPYFELDGYEADDLIATYTRIATERNIEVRIISSDKDLMQLIRDGVTMVDPIKFETIGEEKMLKKFAVTDPRKIIDVQAMSGDSVDNVPGVPGIGPKTAAALLEEFGDLEGILQNAEKIPQKKRRENLIEFADLARISKQLVMLADDAPVPGDLDTLDDYYYDHDRLMTFLNDNEFTRLANRIERKFGTSDSHYYDISNDNAEETSEEKQVDTYYELVTDIQQLQNYCKASKQQGIIAVDTETNSITPAQADLVGISLCVEPGKACYIPLGHKGKPAQGSLLDDPEPQSQDEIQQLSPKDVFAELNLILEDPAILKVGHNLKYDIQMLERFGAKVAPYDDTIVLSYVLDGSQHSHSLDNLCRDYFDHENIQYKSIVGTGQSQKTLDEVTPQEVLNYAAEDADMTRRLYDQLKPRITAEKMAGVYETLDRPLVAILAEMESNGILVDQSILKDLTDRFHGKIDKLAIKIYDQAGQEFNIGSPKQVGEILFDQMGLEGGKKTRSGAWSTSADLLEDLADQGHEIVKDILAWRQLSKLVSTYTEALARQTHSETGRIHTSFTQTITSTGRLSSTDPNLQNIPIRTEEGREIRKAFVPAEGHSLLCIDYSQVELRLVAHMAGIEKLKKAFYDGVDIHSLTASEVFGIPIDELTPERRRAAKAINFGIIYGISGYGLGRQLNIDPKEAKDYIDLYFERFPELKTFMEETKDFARQHGYVETLFGRKCYVPEIKSSNYNQRSFGERQAINAPLQGTAADIMKKAMIGIDRYFKAHDVKAKMLLQVHDELIFEVPDSDLESVSKIVKEIMETVIELDVPLIADVGVGQNWDEAH